MKKLLLALAIVLYPCLATGAPFLVCDEDPNVDSYLVSLNGAPEVEVPAPLHFDLDGIAEGSHNVEVKAKNVWGVSSASPFDFVKSLPSVTNIRLSSD